MIEYQIPWLTDHGTVCAATLTLSGGISKEAVNPNKFHTDTFPENLLTETKPDAETIGERG